MDNLKYSHKIQKDNIMGKLDVYDDMMNIVTGQTNRKIDFNFINSIFLSQINKIDFEIELKNNELIHLKLLDSEKEKFSETYDYISNHIKTDDENIQKTGPTVNHPESNIETNVFNVNKTINENTNHELDEGKPIIPLIINASSTINKNVLYGLSNEAFIKQDLTYLNNDLFQFDGKFGVYGTYINIDNPQFELNLHYNMLRNIELKTTLGTVLILTLNTGSSIFINPIDDDKNKMQQIYHIIRYYINNPTISNNNISQVPAYNNQFIQQQQQQPYYPPNYQQPQYNQPPINKKSVLVAIILHLLLIGLGYAYMNKWGKFLAVLFIALICVLTSFLILPVLIVIILWVYVLIDTISMVDKYNNGQQY